MKAITSAMLVVKPMTMTAAKARKLVAAAETAGVFLMEAMWARFNPTIRRVQELVAAGEVSEVRTVHANFGLPFSVDPESQLWKADLGGGTMLDPGIYPVTIAYLMFGRPSVPAAHGTIGDTGVDCEASMLLGYPDGQQALLGSSITTLLPMSASGGTEARIEIEHPRSGAHLDTGSSGCRTPAITSRFRSRAAAMYRCCGQ